jgi:hypothetical protein
MTEDALLAVVILGFLGSVSVGLFAIAKAIDRAGLRILEFLMEREHERVNRTGGAS